MSHKAIGWEYLPDMWEISRVALEPANNRPGKSNLPTGIQMSEQITQIEGKTEDTSQTELVMAAAVSEIKAIDSLSLEEAMEWPDYSK